MQCLVYNAEYTHMLEARIAMVLDMSMQTYGHGSKSRNSSEHPNPD